MTRSNRVPSASFPSAILVAALTFATLAPAARTAHAAPAPLRDYVPAQAGYRPQANPVATFAPGRVLIKFTPAALRQASFAAPADKGGAVAGARTGLASLDGLLRGAGVSRLERVLVNVADKAARAEAATDRWYAATVAADTDLPHLAEQLAADPNLEAVELDWYVFPATVPNDPNQAANWGHDNTAQLPAYGWGTTWNHTGAGVGTVGFDTNARYAWGGTQGYGNADVIIAIIDSGVDTAHPDLLRVPGYDFGSNDGNPHDEGAAAGHGTCCAGVAAAVANNSLGAAGIAGGCSIMPLKIATATGSMTLAAAANALYFAADNGADIASMSFGAALTSNSVMDAAITYANNAGVVMFAATGNENASTVSYPAINALVIAVGAASPCGDRKRSSSAGADLNPGVSTDPNGTTCDGERWWGSNYGRTTVDHAGAVDLVAPTILPTTDISGSGGYQPGDYEPFFNGTSCATPYAAGVAALVRAQNPGWTPAQVRARLTGTAIDIVSVESVAGWDRYTGYGLVDAQAAVGAPGDLPPLAAFATEPLRGCAPFNVTFTDQSTGPIDGRSWDFGDATTDTAAAPTHEYTVPGSFDVRLVVFGPGGADTLTVPGAVVVDGPVTADFTGDQSTGAGPLTVAFTDQSTGDAAGWLWDFGDGQTDTVQNPTHVYAHPGAYDVSLTVTGPCGDDVELKPGLVTVSGLSGVGDVAIARFGLDRNYPNPFNPVTTIAYSLGSPAHARLEIFDATGRLVEVLVDESRGAGRHTVDWQPDGRASGVYFARFAAEGRVATTRMVLLK
ncbi:MAG: S8 family serine peptidase [bacterium]|nr:S8 family serine peptidase [bacterium]